ncbi:MAG: acyl-CoA dehydrogenase family protein [Actinomycetota bacterium]
MTGLVDRVAAFADDELWPLALDVDGLERIPTAHYERLAELGLFALSVPTDLGGLGLDPPTTRDLMRTLGRGCGATAFAFAQHLGVAAAVARTDNTALSDEWLPRLRAGTLGGTAFAHVRRRGAPVVRAEPGSDDGWRLHGTAPWATSWGTAAVFSVAAVAPDGRIVWVLVTGEEQPGMRPEPLPLMVFGATATVRLRFDDLVVPPERVLRVDEAEPWRRADRRGAARPNPLCLAVGDRALRLLRRAAPEIATEQAEVWDAVGERSALAAALVDTGADLDDEAIATVAAARAESILAVQQMTTALLAAVGGRGAERSHPAQLLARQSLFYVIQAQNADGRAATLAALT